MTQRHSHYEHSVTERYRITRVSIIYDEDLRPETILHICPRMSHSLWISGVMFLLSPKF